MKSSNTSKRLKLIMKNRNLRQVDILNLAKPFCEEYHIKLGKNDLSQYVSGKVEPGQEKLAILGHALGLNEAWLMGYDVPMERAEPSSGAQKEQEKVPSNAVPIDFAHLKRIPILGRIAAGKPIYAEENIEGYTYTDLNGGHEYFGLRVRGDSMDAARIHDGDVVIVRRQDIVDNGQIAVCLIDGEEVTLKRFSRVGDTVTLTPQSTNSTHEALTFNIRRTHVDILGLVVKVEFSPV